MSSTKSQLRLMYLSGTVSIPAQFPKVGTIAFGSIGSKNTISVTESDSPKVVITRTFFKSDVVSIFLPADSEKVDLEKGSWYEDSALDNLFEDNLDETLGSLGIVYVKENASSMLEVQAGLTAAESAEYYPPLPDDRSVNHYDMSGGDLYSRFGKAGCWS